MYACLTAYLIQIIDDLSPSIFPILSCESAYKCYLSQRAYNEKFKCDNMADMASKVKLPGFAKNGIYFISFGLGGLVRSNFLCSIIIFVMKATITVATLLLVSLTQAQTTLGTTQVINTLPIKKGLTFQATVWPSYGNNWAGRFSCNNCNPFEGDTPCNRSLPLVCISSAKSMIRPLYNIPNQYTPFAIQDGGYYEGWSGGYITVTLPVQGLAITSYKVGDALCKGYFGNNSNFATFDSGFYMPYMNQPPIKAWGLWNWSLAKQGQWNFWGYFNHRYRGRAWVWVKGQPNGNCGN